MRFLGFLRRDQGTLHHRTVGHDRKVGSLANHLGLAERNHEIRSRIRRLVVGLAVEVLVLEKEHGIVAADGGPQEAVGVERGRRADRPEGPARW